MFFLGSFLSNAEDSSVFVKTDEVSFWFDVAVDLITVLFLYVFMRGLWQCPKPVVSNRDDEPSAFFFVEIEVRLEWDVELVCLEVCGIDARVRFTARIDSNPYCEALSPLVRVIEKTTIFV